ncbi:glycoside hydrolase family 113 [Clostridium nigeriense]|uniref:glycoside hydrolase family 113 n=1 Tax=Clostridium nigeriense TaxID=1805470 RepID=UPI00083700E3|nr:hypothetical protein [Clostridium nigeriense]
MIDNFEIKSFNFVTWNWEKDIVVKDVKKEIDYQVENCYINTITFAFAAYQEHCYSTEIHWQGSHMPKEKELVELIRYAQEKGLKVILKPMINVSDGYWRAYIRFFDEDVPCEPKWKDWFNNYNEYLTNYAKLSEIYNVDMLIIGCELVGTDHREGEWRYLIKELRKLYKGKLTYNCDKYQEHNINWWDDLDYISSSGYYPVGSIRSELKRIEAVVKRFNKPFFFSEAGCPAVKDASKAPNDWTIILNGIPSEDEQCSFYEELFNESIDSGFVKGFCFWDWPMKSPKKNEEVFKKDYCVKFKKSEKIIAKNFKAI